MSTRPTATATHNAQPSAPVVVVALAHVAFGGIPHPPGAHILVTHADATIAERLALVRRLQPQAQAHGHAQAKGHSHNQPKEEGTPA
jgi:hypothetical protein